MAKSFQFLASTINGEIQEFPVPFDFPCDQVSVVGVMIIRDYDGGVNYIVAKKVFIIQYREDLFGTTQFGSSGEFYQYLESICVCCPEPCPVVFKTCPVLFNGCVVQYLRQFIVV